MEKYILFFDIDGTIYYHKKFPFYIVSAIKKVQKAGHYVVLNTGRPKATIPPIVMRKIKWDGFVCGAGYAEFHSEIIYDERFSHEDFSALLQIIDENKIPTRFDGIEGSKAIYHPKHNSAKDIRTIIDEGWEKNVYKMQMSMHVPPELAEKIARHAYIFNMGNYCDVFITGFTKATGIQKICEKTGIPVSKTLAFGDNRNDYDMLRFAGKSIAMKQAPTAVADIATYHAKHYTFGVLEGIKKFLPLD